jgi:hypothetical protein
MMAETRKVSRRGALKLKFMMPPNENAPSVACARQAILLF